MGKPWARLVLGYMRHPKFLALNGNAIALWHEGKNYCDEHQTDGLIPHEAVKTFRFRGQKTIAMLQTTCATPKPDGSPYAPLWEPHPVGYKMHDYLDHNDCRDVVLARMEQADERRDDERKRKAEWRAKKKDKRDLSRGTRDGTVPSPGTSLSRSTTEPETPPEPETPVPTKQGQGGSAPPALRPRPMAPIHDTSHRKHAVCGRVCLHASLFNDFVRRRNHDHADQEIRAWAEGVVVEWTMGVFQTVEPGDPFDFWKARYAEQWPAASGSAPSRLPAWARKAQA
jgi:hypothetical protein